MTIEVPRSLEPLIQHYAAEHGWSLNEAYDWLLKRGVAVFRSEQTAAKIPSDLQGPIVSSSQSRIMSSFVITVSADANAALIGL